MSETKPESKIMGALKVYQWVEVYRAVADGEIKAAIKTLYKMKCWHDLHVALWTWLSLDGEREKREWFETFDVPEVRNYCFACEVAKECFNCPMERNGLWQCTNGLYARWIDANKIAEREKLAREIATMKWEERI